MSRRIEKCHICKGTGLITVDDWLTKGMTEEQIAKKKEEALSDIAEVVRCKDCIWCHIEGFDPILNRMFGCCERPLGEYIDSVDFEVYENDFCSYGERKG